MTTTQDRLLSRAEAADVLAVSPKTLAEWATNRIGPPYFRVGKHSRYRLSELLDWLETRRAS